MAGTTGSLNRKILVAVLATLGCVALLLFCVRLAYAQPMEASYYGPDFEGNLTANGEVFDSSGYTAAHKTYAFDTKLIVTYEGRSMVVRINDRGPYIAGRELDLAQGAAEYIGLTAVGVGVVDVEVADASTPVGPYSAPGNNRSAGAAAPAPETQEVKPTADPAADQPEEMEQSKPARQQNGAGANVNAARVVEEQYGTEDQYAAEDQYEKPAKAEQAAVEPPPPAPPAPKPAVPVLPPEPEPEALESPPVELAVPNSTIQKRVELKVAAEPTPQPVEEEAAEPAPEPVEEEVVEPTPEPLEEEVVEPDPEPKEEETPEPSAEKSDEKPSDELTELPDTGGASLLVPAAGALLATFGLLVRLRRH